MVAIVAVAVGKDAIVPITRIDNVLNYVTLDTTTQTAELSASNLTTFTIYISTEKNDVDSID